MRKDDISRGNLNIYRQSLINFRDNNQSENHPFPNTKYPHFEPN